MFQIILSILILWLIIVLLAKKYIERDDDEIILTIKRKGKSIRLTDKQLNEIIDIIRKND